MRQAKQAAVEASMANVRRLQQLQSFENVYAPFDGVVTARNTDIGDLITGGSAGEHGEAAVSPGGDRDAARVCVGAGDLLERGADGRHGGR